MPTIRSWEVSDTFWERVEPLIPPVERKAGGGRKPMPPRQIFEAIIYVLRTGWQWEVLPKERFGSASVIHAHFIRWMRAVFFVALWRASMTK